MVADTFTCLSSSSRCHLSIRRWSALDPSQCHLISLAHSCHGVSDDCRDGQCGVTYAEADDVSIWVLLQVRSSPPSDLRGSHAIHKPTQRLRWITEREITSGPHFLHIMCLFCYGNVTLWTKNEKQTAATLLKGKRQPLISSDILSARS